MINLRTISIRARLVVLGVFATVALLVTGGFGYSAVRESRQMFSDFADNDVAALVHLANLRANVGNLRRYEKDMLINLADAKAVEKYHREWTKAFDDSGKAVKGIESRDLPAEVRTALTGIAQGLQGYRGGLDGIYQRLVKQEFADTASANKAMEPLKGSVRAVDHNLAALTELIGKESAADVATAQQRGQVIQITLSVVMGVAALVLSTYTVLSIRSILLPLNAAVATSAQIADHDLSEDIAVEGRDEAAQLQQGMRSMQGALRDMLGRVIGSSQGIASASSQVAAGSTDLSQRTVEAAASLEQTTAAVGQLSTSVRQTFDSAQHASQLATEAARVAERGGSVVNEVVQTMLRISDSSRQIGDIISVIDGIAFQTNILALNAAVEAARAGEQGRGFAVVAAEVRMLAQRSAAAAREVKTLINASAESVNAGAALVTSAGDTMREIVDSAHRVNQVVDDITQAAQTQSGGLAQIGAAMQQLDQMTQRNAALVEESSAAAQTLQRQADELSSAVAVFKLH